MKISKSSSLDLVLRSFLTFSISPKMRDKASSIFKCTVFSSCGTTHINISLTYSLSNSTVSCKCIKAALGCVQFSDRQCGIAIPFPRAVDPKRSRLSNASSNSLASSFGVVEAISSAPISKEALVELTWQELRTLLLTNM